MPKQYIWPVVALGVGWMLFAGGLALGLLFRRERYQQECYNRGYDQAVINERARRRYEHEQRLRANAEWKHAGRATVPPVRRPQRPYAPPDVTQPLEVPR